MPILNVDPGDLITSEDWNDLVNAHNALEARVDQLAAGGADGAPQIIQALPTGTVTAGDTIRIYGANFQYSRGAHSVFFGPTRATGFLAGSSDSLLIVQIPDVVEGATAAGASITMTVANLYAYATWGLTIRSKPDEVSGDIGISYQGSDPATPTAGDHIDYEFLLTSRASEDLNVIIAPDIDVVLSSLPTGTSIPRLTFEIRDVGGVVRADGRVMLLEGESKTIIVRVNIPSGVLNGVQYNITVVARATGVASVSDSVPQQQIGQAGEQPDPTVTSFGYRSTASGVATFAPEASGSVPYTGILRIPANSTAIIEMRAAFANIPAGSTFEYQISEEITPSTASWVAQVESSVQNPMEVVGTGGTKDIYFEISAPPAGSNPAVFHMKLTRQGTTTDNEKTVAYQLRLQ